MNNKTFKNKTKTKQREKLTRQDMQEKAYNREVVFTRKKEGSVELDFLLI